MKKINFRVLYTLFSIIIVLSGAYLAILYAKGNLRLKDDGNLGEVGLLSANSFPTGSQVFVNEKLISATDDTLYLDPGEYEIKISKEGYWPWKKTLLIEKGLVAQTNAILFPSTPSLTPLTFTGVENLLPSPDGNKIVYYTASASTQVKNGLYVLDFSDSFLPLQKSPRQISNELVGFDLTKANLIWSPDSSELLIEYKSKSFLLDVGKKNDLAYLTNIHTKVTALLSSWEEEMALKESQFLEEFPDEILQIASQSAKNIYLSPDKKRMLYTATQSAVLPEQVISPVPASNTQPQSRNLEPGGIYVYDRQEDRNFKIGNEKVSTYSAKIQLAKLNNLTATNSAFVALQASNSAQTAANFANYHNSLSINTLQWYPDSKHLIFEDDNKISVIEYDATNKTTLYSGPFADKFLYPWPDGNKLLILASFSPDSPKNLYAVEIRR